MKQIIAELHTHTVHSDGDFTVAELLQSAQMDGISCIALTDHNTCSGFEELMELSKSLPIVAIQGMEWTTYFGHMLVLGARRFVDWQEATPGNIDGMMKQVKSAGGIIGIAHPFVLGTPFCTGGHWDFKVQDWSIPDYIEIWSEAEPASSTYNKLAYDFWISLLGQGYRMAITHGKDWHKADKERVLDGFTILYCDDVSPLNAQTALESIARGRTAVSCGPSICVEVSNAHGTYTIGDDICGGEYNISIMTDMANERKHLSELFDVQPQFAEIITQDGMAKRIPVVDGEFACAGITLHAGFLVVVITGIANGGQTVLSITSPIYVSER